MRRLIDDVAGGATAFRVSDVGVLQQGMTSLATSQNLLAESVSVQSSLPDSLETVRASWKAVADPGKLA